MTGMYHLLARSSKGIMGAQPHLLFHQNPTLKAPPLSLSRIANPVYRETVIFNRAFHGTSCETLAPISDNSHGSSPLCFRHACTLAGRQGIMKGAAASRSLSPQKRGLKLEEAKGYHGVRFEVTQETSARGGQEQQAVASGSIHLIVGPMFAGKTTALLKRVQAEASTGRRVAMVKSDKDTRYGLAAIVSHDGMQMPCWAVPNLANFKAQIGEEAYAKLDLIGIDEAQFLKDLYSFCQVAADYEGKTLIVAGLDGDFQRNRFGSILDLVPLADSVVKLSSHCELCGKPAFFTFRKTDDRNKEVIGGTDIYMPVCRQHFFSGKIAMETARTVLDTHKFVSLQCDNVDRSINNVSGKD